MANYTPRLYVDRLKPIALGYKPVQHGTVLNNTETYNTVVVIYGNMEKIQ